MSVLLSCKGIKKEYGEQNVLKDITFDLKEGEKLGLVGNNGAGKTTLANIIFGKENIDKGSIKWNQNKIKIGYLVQSTFYNMNNIDSMLVNNRDSINEFFEATSLLGMNKVKTWNDERFKELSGGEKTKLALSSIWVQNPKLLILDEPTNHLDFKGVEWLIEEIQNFRGTIIIISHDRYFLDKTVNRILEIEDGLCISYKGNYTSYKDEKKHRYESQLNAYINQEKYKQRIKHDIRNLKGWSEKAHRESRKKDGMKEYFRAKAKKKDQQIKSKIKRLEKIKVEGVKKPKEERKVNFTFDNSVEKIGKRVIEAIDISKGYMDKVLFQNSSFFIKRGERIGIIGENGCGKTTLIKAMLGEVNIDSGKMYISPSTKVSYISQDVLDLNEDNYIIEQFNIRSKEKLIQVQTLLANLGFNQSMINKPIRNLSLGERTKLKIANLVLDDNNVLILDEPTNHLDLNSREKLEETLAEYKGTIIIASHDRYMLEKMCNKLLIFQDNKIKRIEKGYKEYFEKVEVNKSKNGEEESLISKHRIAFILGELNKYDTDSLEYKKLDEEFKELIKKQNKY